MMFPEDDEIEDKAVKNASQAVGRIDRDMNMMAMDSMKMAEERVGLIEVIKSQQLDPHVKKIAKLAQDAGHALGANEALLSRVKHLEKRIAVRDEKLAEWSDYNTWRNRALNAEAKIDRSEKAKRARRKK